MMPEKLKELTTHLSPRMSFDNQSYLYFGGTAYLSIPQHADFTKLYIEGIKKYGLNNGTSRNNNVQQGIYNAFEHFAAEKYGAEEAIVLSSGYLAAQFLVKYVSELGTIRYAPATHPALWLNGDPEVEGSFQEWSESIVKEINESSKKEWVLISNSMNNIFPEIYDFSFLQQLNKDKKVTLVLDDSHGIGLNNNGRSALSNIPHQAHVAVILVASMAKALGVDAGLILGPAIHTNRIKNNNNFFGASPPAAAGLYAFMNATAIYEQERKKLFQNIEFFAKAIDKRDIWTFIPDFPVFLAKNLDLSAKLFDKNILISSFPYPKKDDEIVNRIVLTSRHEADDMLTLINSI